MMQAITKVGREMDYNKEANDAYDNEQSRLSWICSATDEQLIEMSRPMQEMFESSDTDDPEYVREYARKRQEELDSTGRDKFVTDYIEKREQEKW